ncbi:MAG: hypothetical protein IPN34_23555 [Planctomycetes bacterium]|nr:hypothetical protein [Planctomycetota bacterium]
MTRPPAARSAEPEAARLFQALAHPTRIAILAPMLADGWRSLLAEGWKPSLDGATPRA